MAKNVVWSLQAQNDRKEILRFWRERSKSNSYSKKLNEIFKSAVQLIAKYPKIGRKTDLNNIRIKVVRDYLLLYEETGNK